MINFIIDWDSVNYVPPRLIDLRLHAIYEQGIFTIQDQNYQIEYQDHKKCGDLFDYGHEIPNYSMNRDMWVKYSYSLLKLIPGLSVCYDQENNINVRTSNYYFILQTINFKITILEVLRLYRRNIPESMEHSQENNIVNPLKPMRVRDNKSPARMLAHDLKGTRKFCIAITDPDGTEKLRCYIDLRNFENVPEEHWRIMNKNNHIMPHGPYSTKQAAELDIKNLCCPDRYIPVQIVTE